MRGRTGPAGHHHQVARPGAGALQRRVFFHQAECGDADVQRAGGHVPSGQEGPRLRRQPRHAVCEPIQPLAVGARQGHGEEKPCRFGAHGRQVAEVYGQGLVPHRCCRSSGGKVHALDQAVGANDQLPVHGQFQDGGVVADTQNALGTVRGLLTADPFLQSPDQVELRHRTQGTSIRSASALRH